MHLVRESRHSHSIPGISIPLFRCKKMSWALPSHSYLYYFHSETIKFSTKKKLKGALKRLNYLHAKSTTSVSKLCKCSAKGATEGLPLAGIAEGGHVLLSSITGVASGCLCDSSPRIQRPWNCTWNCTTESRRMCNFTDEC